MTITSETPRSRQPFAEYEAHRRAILLLRLFVGRFEAWHHLAARAGAIALSHLTTEAEKRNQRAILGALREEVEAAYDEFTTAIAGHPSHSRIDDVEAAFERLLSALGSGHRSRG